MVKLKVPDMSCDHCIRTIEKGIKAVDPAAVVKADLGASTVTVETQTDAARIAEAVRAAGYDNTQLAG
jgi:copper chaperone